VSHASSVPVCRASVPTRGECNGSGSLRRTTRIRDSCVGLGASAGDRALHYVHTIASRSTGRRSPLYHDPGAGQRSVPVSYRLVRRSIEASHSCRNIDRDGGRGQVNRASWTADYPPTRLALDDVDGELLERRIARFYVAGGLADNGLPPYLILPLRCQKYSPCSRARRARLP
jgi:hypothetical protein